MARKARQRISYVLPLANSAGGHRLGVNGLAVDPQYAILYSGGRDGVICAWDLNLDLTKDDDPFHDRHAASEDPAAKRPSTVFRQQVQAHTHWINDIALVQNNEALVSASSDVTVKVWRPAAQDVLPPQTIGLHSDYVKCIASPSPHANWVASGGLDRKICLWDLNGRGKKLEIAVGEDENTAKGSVYALGVTGSIIASGGPESIVRVWDSRSGKRVTKFVGHTDNIRDVLIAQDEDTIMTASSDQTVKVWSMTAGRCMYTLTMHNESVWSLYSDHPQLSVFYSSDRSGLVAKTDVRNCIEMDEGLSVAVSQEHGGVNKVIAAGDYIWTATSSSSINRWKDVDTELDIQTQESYRWHRASIGTVRSKMSSPSAPPPQYQSSGSQPNGTAKKQIPRNCILRLSNASPFPFRDEETSTTYTISTARKSSNAFAGPDIGAAVPFNDLPDHSIEGQNGLIKHVLLNDRRRVLTLDTAGEVELWDLLQCIPIKKFGKRHLEDVAPEVNTTETVAHWCAVDTRTGSLTCVLEENYCFDAEMYADELQLEEKIDFREDQRINLGKWILRYLFSNLIDEEIKRDEAYRQKLLREGTQGLSRPGAPNSIQLPNSNMNGWQDPWSGPTSASTLRPTNSFHLPLQTPGLAIGLATPAIAPLVGHSGQHPVMLSPTAEEGPSLERTTTQKSHSRGNSSDRPGDYFSTAPTSHPQPPTTPGVTNGHSATVDGTDAVPQSPTDGEKETPAKEGVFGKFRMNMPKNMSFGMGTMKKLGRTQTAEAAKTVVVEEKSDNDSASTSSKTEERVIEDNFFGIIQRIRHGYEDQLQAGAQTLVSGITPSLPNETPVLKPPLATTILIQEDRPEAGGVADLFEGKVGTLGLQADLIEKVAPMWLGDVVLRNHIPLKEIVKVSFILEPFQGLLPPISTDGNNRLNANRMLRARKILAYVAERIESPSEDPDPNPMKPEEYLELYCQNHLISPTTTLAAIRTHIWRGGQDVVLYYKANGRKEIRQPPAQVLGPQYYPVRSSTESDRRMSAGSSTKSQRG